MLKNELKIKAKLLKPTVWLGKSGLEESHLKEIKKQLKIRKLIKVKILKSLLDTIDRKTLAKELAEQVNAELIDVVGGVIVLYKNGSSR